MSDMTPEQWRDHLLPSLRAQMVATVEHRRWLDGPHPWPTPPEAIRERLQRMVAALASSAPTRPTGPTSKPL